MSGGARRAPKQTPLDRLKRAVEAIDAGRFELIEYGAAAVEGEPGRYTLTVLIENLVPADSSKIRKRTPRQSKIPELIFDEE